MVSSLEIPIAILVGVAVALQGALNASLGERLEHPLFGSIVAFGVGLGATSVAVVLWLRRLPTPNAAEQVPNHLWYAGGLVSAVAIVAFYWLIPRIGISTTISLSLVGQLGFATLAGHHGWLQLPSTPFTPIRLVGVLSLLIGVFLLHRGN